MLRLFDRVQDKETNVSTNFSYEFKIRTGIGNSFTDFSGSGNCKPCYNKEDFEKAFES